MARRRRAAKRTRTARRSTALRRSDAAHRLHIQSADRSLVWCREIGRRVDGRVFAIDIADRRVPKDKTPLAEPWWFDESPNATAPWCTGSWVWQPPPFEPRMVRQEGCFLMGGVPSTNPARAVWLAGVWRPIRAHEVRETMSLPFVLINYQQAVAAYNNEWFPGAQPLARSFTLRIRQKPELRRDIEQAFGYSHWSLFPDFPGIAGYGRSFR